MPISNEEIAEIHPQLYHMAEYGSWESIQQRGLLSTTALLNEFAIEGTERDQIESGIRRTSVEIANRNGEIFVIRDQRPMSESKLQGCLQDGLRPVDWYRMLNQRVFFWLTEERLARLMSAYGDTQHLVLEVDTAELLARHGDRVTLTPMNTGCTSPMAFPRGMSSFLPPNLYPFDENRRKKGGSTKAIVELTVLYSVPDIAEFTNRATHRRIQNGQSVIVETLYE